MEDHFRNDSGYEIDLKTYHVVLTLSVLPLVVIFNGLLIALVFIFRRLQDEQNKLMVAIAFFDMMFGLIVTPLYALHYSGFDEFTEFEYGCIGMYSLVIMITNGRCCFLQFLTLDRYIAVIQPFWYHEHVKSGDVYKYATGVLVCYLLLVGLLPMIGVNTYQEGHCSFYTIWPIWFKIVFYFTPEALTVVIPTILNVIIFRTVRQQQRRLVAAQMIQTVTSTHQTGHQKAKNRTVMISMLVYVEYLVFYIPNLISMMVRTHLLRQHSAGDPHHSESGSILYFDYLATMWQWGLMPTIYPFMLICIKKDYQKAIDLLVTKPFWQWRHLCYDKLGHEFSTNFGAVTQCAYDSYKQSVIESSKTSNVAMRMLRKVSGKGTEKTVDVSMKCSRSSSEVDRGSAKPVAWSLPRSDEDGVPKSNSQSSQSTCCVLEKKESFIP